MDMENNVLNFIKTRFPNKDHWLDGNCYYFSVILKERFGGTILYDVIDGHFVTEIGGVKYDWSGIAKDGCFVEWDRFCDYDGAQMKRIIRDCIM